MRPTNSQIASGLFVLPRRFYQIHRDTINWQDFTAIAFGQEYKHRRLDQSYRVRIRLSGLIELGDAVAVELIDNVLHVSRVQN